jgi:hypothetical protein
MVARRLDHRPESVDRLIALFVAVVGAVVLGGVRLMAARKARGLVARLRAAWRE